MSKSVDFSKELAELEAIIEWFEKGDVDLDEALIKFERGMALATKLKQHLDEVENKVEIIKKKFDKATPSTDAETVEEPGNTDAPELF